MNNKVILVTGGSKGIGAAIAKKFGENGYNVAINFCESKDKAEEVAAYIKKHGGDAETFGCNISDFEAAKKMVNDVAKKYGKIDVLVNNAGITEKKSFFDKTPQDWYKVLDVNLIAPFVISREAAKYMKKGVIINISSTSATMHNPNRCNYDASKAGLNTLTKNLAIMYQPNIRVVSISPGYVETDMNTGKTKERLEQIKEETLNRSIASPDDIANTAFFVASEQAKHINATEIVVSGGLN